ncbi:DUF6052 family protein [Streptomyces bambusae]|uniref:DUF6052 family protein n=1 Tax=Streptomyces bambusae TaxID=1550616 RepID=UPI001CFCB65D|nr:DUF6052 family protein [Streptomyces bambusae]MCB5165671.1 DUF6052 family protein [Streptomyces bambusae]
MTNANSPLTAEQEQQLLRTYHELQDLAQACGVPAVRAAVKTALAELRTALDGQAVDFEYYPGQAGVFAA